MGDDRQDLQEARESSSKTINSCYTPPVSLLLAGAFLSKTFCFRLCLNAHLLQICYKFPLKQNKGFTVKTRKAFVFMVPEAGIEPAQHFCRGILSPCYFHKTSIPAYSHCVLSCCFPSFLFPFVSYRVNSVSAIIINFATNMLQILLDAGDA